MAIARVAGQQAKATSAGALTLTVTLPNNPTPGNLVVFCVDYAVVGTPTGVKDSNNNAYVATTGTPTAAGSGAPVGIWYLQNAPANATKTITITFNNSATTGDAWASEYSGALTASVFERDAVHTSATSSTNINDPTITTTNDGDLLIGIAAVGGTISAATSPWTVISTVSNGNWTEDFVQATHGAQAMGFTQSPGAIWVSIIAAFRAAVVTPYIPYNPWPQLGPTLAQ